MAGTYRGRRMGGQLVFFNVTVRATLPLNYYSLLSHSSSNSTTVRILLPIIFMVGEWQRKDWICVGWKRSARWEVLWWPVGSYENLNEENRTWDTYLQLSFYFTLRCFLHNINQSWETFTWCLTSKFVFLLLLFSIYSQLAMHLLHNIF